jgi:excisionase family DNA binding protein
MHEMKGASRMTVEVPERILLDVDDAAQAVAISRRKLQYLINSGEVPVVRIGRSVRVPLSGLRAYVDRLAIEQT